jgi:hypothetical protein
MEPEGAAVDPPAAVAEEVAAAPAEEAPSAEGSAAGFPLQHEAPALQAPPAKRYKRRKDKGPSFNDMLYELLEFRSKTGHCRVPLKSKVGKWVTNLRAQVRT